MIDSATKQSFCTRLPYTVTTASPSVSAKNKEQVMEVRSDMGAHYTVCTAYLQLVFVTSLRAEAIKEV